MLTVFGTSWCQDCKKLRSFLRNHHKEYTWINIEENTHGEAQFQKLLEGQTLEVPVLLEENGTIHIHPSEQELRNLFNFPAPHQRHYEVVIIGAGPAGMTAAIYAARDRQSTLVLDKAGIGGHAITTATIENYPGFPHPIKGTDLMHAMEEQALHFGAELAMGVELQSFKQEKQSILLTTSEGIIHARTVLLAIGTQYRHLHIPGEEENTGKGVHYCATCDGPFYRDKKVIVIGGGNSAIQEALFLAQFAEHITIVTSEDRLTASILLQNKIAALGSKVTLLYEKSTIAIQSDKKKVTGILVESRSDKRQQTIPGDGVFVFIGLQPQTKWLRPSLTLDAQGFIVTNTNLMSSMVGVFAAGDCRAGATMQIASAVGEGAAAAIMMRHYLDQTA